MKCPSTNLQLKQMGVVRLRREASYGLCEVVQVILEATQRFSISRGIVEHMFAARPCWGQKDRQSAIYARPVCLWAQGRLAELSAEQLRYPVGLVDILNEGLSGRPT